MRAFLKTVYLSNILIKMSQLGKKCGVLITQKEFVKEETGGFPGGAVVKNLPVNAGDTGSSPGLGGSHVPQSN